MIAAVKSLLAASVLGLAAAVPVNEAKPGSFKVIQQRNPNYDNSTFVPRGALAMYKAYMKYGAPIPDAINKTVSEYHAAKQARLAKRASSGTVTVSTTIVALSSLQTLQNLLYSRSWRVMGYIPDQIGMNIQQDLGSGTVAFAFETI
jgi:hypothetical protein